MQEQDLFTEFQETLQDSFTKTTKICEDIDSFALKSLGHHYVRVNNKNMLLRGNWRKWTLSMLANLRDCKPELMKNVLLALEHFLKKLER